MGYYQRPYWTQEQTIDSCKKGLAVGKEKNWLDHFKNLLGETPTASEDQELPRIQIADALNISTEPFSMEELKAVTSILKVRQSPCLDNIPALIWKDPIFHDLLLRICTHTSLHCNPPSAWRKTGITPLPKKGDLTLLSNYRGISLSAIASKIYNKLLLRRVAPEVDPLLRENQNGFRKGRSTISQILSLRRIIEEMRKHNKELTLFFVDFRNAFDSISRQAIFDIFPLYGIPEPIVEAIKSLYTNTDATVITPDGETEFFEITAGVLQGDTLAPFFFIIVLDYILRLSLDNLNDRGVQIQPRGRRRHPAQQLTDLDFADDLALITELVEDAEALLQSLERAAARIGLYCNESKTEYINTTDSSHNLKSLSGGTI